MSVSTEITRIQGAKADLKASIEAKGVTVPSATLISGYAALVDQISGGGGLPDSDGLVDLTIATGNMYESASTLTLTYIPTYLMRYTPSSAISNRSGLTVSKSVTYPAVVWSCTSPWVTISGYTATIQAGADTSATFTATWTDYNGDTHTTSKVILIKNLAYSMITTTGYTSTDKYFVTTTWPTNIGVNSYETYRPITGTDYYICTGTASPPSWGGGYTVLSNNGTSASIFNSVADAKEAIDSLR